MTNYLIIIGCVIVAIIAVIFVDAITGPTLTEVIVTGNLAKLSEMKIKEEPLEADINGTKLTAPPLFLAIACGQREIFQQLATAKGLDYLNQRQNVWFEQWQESITPLEIAIAYRQAEIAIDLMEMGVDLDSRNSSDCTPLHLACRDFDKRAVIESLLEHGADIHAVNDALATPLHEATFAYSESAVDCLLGHGADFKVKNNVGVSPIDFALSPYRKNLAEIFIRHGIDLD